MEEEWYDDRCCATCVKGELEQDDNEGAVVFCNPLNDYVATDYYCPGYEN